MYKYYDNLEKNKITLSNDGIINDFFFSNGYFITPNGYLYNTSKSNGHRYNGFVNEYDYITSLIKNKKSLSFLKADINYYKNTLSMLIDNNCIEYEKLESWLKSIYELPKNMNLVNEKNNYDTLIQLYMGYCDAHIEFYNYFINIFNENAIEKLDSIDIILGNVNIYDKLVEILVRCMGFHKIELHNSKNITTSSLHPVNDFSEYLYNDYNIWIVPKIIFDNDFKEIDLNNSIPISSFTAIENFEDENPDKGKVRILGM